MKRISSAVTTPNVIVLIIFLILGILIVCPLFLVVLQSFLGKPLMEPGNFFTFKNYARVFSSRSFQEGLFNTSSMAVMSTLMAALWGVVMGWLIARTDVPLKKYFEIAIMIPIFIPAMILSIAWTALASEKVGILNQLISFIFHPGKPLFNIYSKEGVIWVMALQYTTYFFIFVSSSLRSMDPSLEEASAMSGASIWRTLRSVTFPLTLPAILSSIILIFTQSWGLFTVPFILGNPEGYKYISTEIYDKMNVFPPDVGYSVAVSSLLLVIILIAVPIQNHILRGRRFVTVTGRGYRPQIIPLGQWKYVGFAICLAYVLLAFVLPFGMLFVWSIMKTLGGAITWTNFTIANYGDVLKDTVSQLSIRNTMIVALVGATAGAMFSLIIEYLIHRKKIFGKKTLTQLTMLPLSIPSLILGLGFLWLWLIFPINLYGSLWVLPISFIGAFLPFGVRAFDFSFRQIDQSLEEASQIHGASEVHTIRRVLLPLLKPGLISGWVLLFISMMRELGVILFIYGAKSIVLTAAILELYIAGSYNMMVALTMIQVTLILVCLAVVIRVFGFEVLRT
jgi:iron(III) transport system permease protein